VGTCTCGSKSSKLNSDLITSITVFIQTTNQEVSVAETDSLRNEGLVMISIPKVVMYVSPVCQIRSEDMVFAANNFTERTVLSVFKLHG